MKYFEGALLGLWMAWCVIWFFEMRQEEGGAMPIGVLVFWGSLAAGVLVIIGVILGKLLKGS